MRRCCLLFCLCSTSGFVSSASLSSSSLSSSLLSSSSSSLSSSSSSSLSSCQQDQHRHLHTYLCHRTLTVVGTSCLPNVSVITHLIQCKAAISYLHLHFRVYCVQTKLTKPVLITIVTIIMMTMAGMLPSSCKT